MSKEPTGRLNGPPLRKQSCCEVLIENLFKCSQERTLLGTSVEEQNGLKLQEKPVLYIVLMEREF